MANLAVGGRQSLYGGSDADVVSTIDAILKLDYIMEDMVDTVNKSTWFLSQITREKMTGGKKFQFTIQTGLAEGQGNRAENAPLPDFGAGSYEEISYFVRYQYATMRLSGPAMAVSNKRSAVYASILTNALKDVRNGFTLETYFQTMGRENGTVALVKGAVNVSGAGATVVVPFDSPYGQDEGNNAFDRTAQFPFFRVGMQLAFLGGTVAAPTLANQGVVNGIDPQGRIRVLMKSGGNLPDNAIIVRGDGSVQLANAAAINQRTSLNKNYVGLVDIVNNTGMYLDFDRTNQPGWQSTVLSAANNAVSEPMLQDAYNMIEVRSDGMSTSPNLLLSNHKTQTLYMQTLIERKRFINPPTDLRGGRSALSFNGKPWTVDKICPPGRVYFLNMKDFCWVYFKRPAWAQWDGRVLRVPEGFDAATAYMHTYRQLVNFMPQNHGVMTGVTGFAENPTIPIN